MVGSHRLIGAAVVPEQRVAAHLGEDADLLMRETVEQVRPQQHLIEDVPKIANRPARFEVKRSAGWAAVTEVSPHGIVEELVFSLLDGARAIDGNATVHDGVEASAGGDHAALEGIHVEIADDDGALMAF